MSSPSQTLPHQQTIDLPSLDAGDAAYVTAMAYGTEIQVTINTPAVPGVTECVILTPPDSAYVLGACKERGISLSEAIGTALVDWAS